MFTSKNKCECPEPIGGVISCEFVPYENHEPKSVTEQFEPIWHEQTISITLTYKDAINGNS